MFKSALFKVFIILMSVIFYAQACPQGDLNGDCCVDMLDLGILAQQWLSPGCNKPGIVGHWLLDDASGSTAIDSSGYGYDGSLFGNPSWTNDVLRGWCLSFDGIDDYVLIGNESAFDISESITVSAWVKADASGNRFQYIVSKGTDSWRLYRRSGTGLYFGCTGLSGNNYILSSSDVLGDGQWHHVAGVYDSGQEKLLLYVDGQLDNSVAASGLISLNDTNVTIGSSLSSNFWTGQIDDVRVYSRALSASCFTDGADLTHNGTVNFNDYALLANMWLQEYPSLCLIVQSKTHLAVTPVSRLDESWWASRHQDVLNRVSQGNVGMIFVGDSITQNWESIGLTTWNSYYSSRNAVNMGFGGDMTQHVLWRLDNGEIDGISPTLAVVMIGTNNVWSHTAQEIADGIDAVCCKIRSKLPNTKILLLAIFPRADISVGLRERLVQASSIASAIANGRNIFFMDISANFLDGNGNLRSDLFIDLVHPNAAGYQIWAAAIESEVAALLAQ